MGMTEAKRVAQAVDNSTDPKLLAHRLGLERDAPL
jgi:hypothetical protein